MSDNMVDVTVHIDENVSAEVRAALTDKLLGLSGVMAAVSHDEKPHLMVVEYDPERIKSSEILGTVKNSGVHAELIGL
ncbi:MAG: ATP-binding protein [Gammaproteobacteria bacterium]|nr:ATP-binding protein [Gammaproteobacteria bacterium]